MYVVKPLQARETTEEDLEPIKELGIIVENEENGKEAVRIAMAMEAGRRVARDIGRPDPERMNPAAIAEYIQNAFKGYYLSDFF